jgi:hypothetical protein
MTRQLEQPLAEGRVRKPVDSFADAPTNLITLSPAFLRALRQIAPAPRPRKLRYALALAAIGAIAWASGQRLYFPHEAVARGGAPPLSSMANVKREGPSSAEAFASPSAHPSSSAAATNGPAASAAASASIAPTRVEDLPRRPAPRPPTKPRAKRVPRDR